MQARPARVTLAQVAREASVSIAAASYALNEPVARRTSAETRERVIAAAERLGYRPNLTARSLAVGASPVVVCVVPPAHLGEPIMELLGELSSALADVGLVLSVHFQSPDRTLTSTVESIRPRLVFPLIPGSMTDAEFSVEVDLSQLSDPGCVLQVELLARAGHRRIAFAASREPALLTQAEWRMASIREACDAAGLPEPLRIDVAWDGSDAAAALRSALSAGASGICAHNDAIAFALLGAMAAVGANCPRDVSVVGYDATTMGAFASPPLTSIRWSPRAVARTMAAAIAAPHSSFESPIDALPLEVEAVERASVAPPSPSSP